MATRATVLISVLAAVAGCSSPPSPPPPAKARPAAAEPVQSAEPVVSAEPAATPEPAPERAWPIEEPALSRVPEGPDVVTLETPGAEPRAALRFSPETGRARTVTLDMTMEVAMTLGNNAIDPSALPTVEVEMKVTPGAEEDGTTPWAFEVVRASREPLESASERLKKAMDTAVEGMKASKGSLSIDAQGRRGKADYGLPEVPTPGLRPSLSGFQQSFSQLFVVLPAEPVGVGATWSSTSHFELSGVPIEQTATYTLQGRDGDVLTLGVRFEQAATGEAESPAGVALEDTQFGGRGSGTLKVRLDSPFPVEAQAQSRSRISSSITMGGAPQPVEMDLLSTLAIKTAS